MKKLYLSTVCLALVSVMILSACANKVTPPSKNIEPANTAVTTDNLSSTKKNTDVYTISSDFTKRSASKNVTLDEVKEIIALAREVYSDYDTVVVDAETTYETVDVPDLSLEKIDKLDTEDQQILDFEKSLSETQYIFLTMLSQYLPEENILIMQGKTSSNVSPDYYFLNIDEKGYKDSKEAYNKMFENGTPSFDKVADCVYVLRGTIYFYDAETDEKEQLFLTPEEKALTAFISDKQASKAEDPEYYIKLHGLDTQ